MDLGFDLASYILEYIFSKNIYRPEYIYIIDPNNEWKINMMYHTLQT